MKSLLCEYKSCDIVPEDDHSLVVDGYSLPLTSLTILQTASSLPNVSEVEGDQSETDVMDVNANHD